MWRIDIAPAFAFRAWRLILVGLVAFVGRSHYRKKQPDSHVDRRNLAYDQVDFRKPQVDEFSDD